MAQEKVQRGMKRVISNREFSVLKYLNDQSEMLKDRITVEVTDIAMGSGVRDSDEVLRALYTLEGKSFVQPEPAGDFTSSQWRITDVGKKAVELF